MDDDCSLSSLACRRQWGVSQPTGLRFLAGRPLCDQSLVSPLEGIAHERLTSSLAWRADLPVCFPLHVAAQADQFQKSGRALRNKMLWQNIKMKLLVRATDDVPQQLAPALLLQRVASI